MSDAPTHGPVLEALLPKLVTASRATKAATLTPAEVKALANYLDIARQGMPFSVVDGDYDF